MRIDKDAALGILLAEAKKADSRDAPAEWEERVEALSAACEHSSRTHIAYLGTVLLAKATNLKADAYGVKEGASNPGSFSARTLGHGVLVPNAAKLGIDLGVTGREPLNNQPYFRLQRATPDAILPLVRDQAPVKVLLGVLEEIDALQSTSEARDALRAFIVVRRRYAPEYATLADHTARFKLGEFSRLIDSFLAEDSEGGKRAQAIAAGIMDGAFGPDRVVAGRINDPDRHLPGDVGVREDSAEDWRFVFEVRDKRVRESDLILFARKCATEGVPLAGVIAVANPAGERDESGAVAWAEAVGVCLRVHWTWASLLRDMTFWLERSPDTFVELSIKAIHKRLIAVEASSQGVAQWVRLTSATPEEPHRSG